MKRSILFFLVLTLIWGSSKASISGENQTKKDRVKIAEQLIKDLRNGALLVRLPARKKTIDAMLETGRIEQAERYKKELKTKNQDLILAFRNNFTFCKVYFFSSEQSAAVLEQKWTSVVFLNDSLKKDTTIQFNMGPYLTGEIANIEMDTTSNFEHNYTTPSSTGPEVKSAQSGGTNFGFQAFIIKTENFVQLRDPFPFYVRTYDSLPSRRSAEKVVRKLDKQLTNYYNKVNKD